MLHKFSNPAGDNEPGDMKGSFAWSLTEEQKLEMVREGWWWECDSCQRTTTFEESRNWFTVKVDPIQSMRWHDIDIFPRLVNGDVHCCTMGCAADFFMNMEKHFED
jgi:hypothetical protein